MSSREDLRDALINKLFELLESPEGIDPEMAADHLIGVFDASAYSDLLKVPKELNDQTLAQVGKFSVRLAHKLLASQKKYGYGIQWMRDDWREECQQHLAEHVRKGDPLDVAAYCMFADFHGWSSHPQVEDLSS